MTRSSDWILRTSICALIGALAMTASAWAWHGGARGGAGAYGGFGAGSGDSAAGGTRDDSKRHERDDSGFDN